MPAQVTGLADQLVATLAHVSSTKSTLDSPQAAPGPAVANLVDAIVDCIQAVDNDEGVSTAASLVAARASAYADKVVAADNAANAWFAAQRANVLTGLASQYMSGVQDGLCVAPNPPLPGDRGRSASAGRPHRARPQVGTSVSISRMRESTTSTAVPPDSTTRRWRT